MSELTIEVYDHTDCDGEFEIDREPNEDDESYARRVELYRLLFDRDR